MLCQLVEGNSWCWCDSGECRVCGCLLYNCDSMDALPKHTIYVKNIYEKIGKTGAEPWQITGQSGADRALLCSPVLRKTHKGKNAELKKCLFCLFSQFGRIADVQCCKTNKLRGQAWIIFADIASATNALQCMNGFPFFEKNLVCYPPCPSCTVLVCRFLTCQL